VFGSYLTCGGGNFLLIYLSINCVFCATKFLKFLSKRYFCLSTPKNRVRNPKFFLLPPPPRVPAMLV
jgi:hypothetical protein